MIEEFRTSSLAARTANSHGHSHNLRDLACLSSEVLLHLVSAAVGRMEIPTGGGFFSTGRARFAASPSDELP